MIPFLDYFTGLTEDLRIGKSSVLLFEVHALKDPTSDAQHIGNIFLTSPLIRSTFGDERLFFLHETMNRDLTKLRKQDKAKGEDRREQCLEKLETTKKPRKDQGLV